MGNKFHIQKQLNEGSNVNQNVEHDDIYKKARILADKCPTGPERIIYVRNQVQKTKSGALDMDVFKMFVKLTNTWMEVKTCENK